MSPNTMDALVCQICSLLFIITFMNTIISLQNMLDTPDT